MQARSNCDFCRSSNLFEIVTDIRDYESDLPNKTNLLRCSECGLVQQNFIFLNSELSCFYASEYHGRNYSKSSIASSITSYLRKRYYMKFVKIIKKISPSKSTKILDYGSGDGFLLRLLRDSGYRDLYACDFFPPYWNDDNLITYFHPDDVGEFTKLFDVVTMINSIEHLSSFSEGLNKIKKSMSPNSKIIIETPNIDSPDFFIFKKYWGGLHQPRHTFLWGKTTLANHLKLLGFHHPIHLGSPQPAHWAISIQNSIAAKFPIVKKLLFKNGRVKGYFIIVLLLLPLGIIQNLLKHESVLNTMAEKK